MAEVIATEDQRSEKTEARGSTAWGETKPKANIVVQVVRVVVEEAERTADVEPCKVEGPAPQHARIVPP